MVLMPKSRASRADGPPSGGCRAGRSQEVARRSPKEMAGASSSRGQAGGASSPPSALSLTPALSVAQGRARGARLISNETFRAAPRVGVGVSGARPHGGTICPPP